MLRGVPRAATRALQTRGLHFTVGGQGQARRNEEMSSQYPGICTPGFELLVISLIKISFAVVILLRQKDFKL